MNDVPTTGPGGAIPDDDDALVALIARAADSVDPVPEHVLLAAKAVPELAHLDDELALLLFDSAADGAVELAGVRSGATTGAGRRLAFRAGDDEIELFLTERESGGEVRLTIDGQVLLGDGDGDGDARAALVLVADDTGTRIEVGLDELGRFSFADVVPGRYRIVLDLGPGRPSVATEAFGL